MMNLLKTKRSFRKEFKRQIKIAIVAAVGFTVAYGWRQAIFDSLLSFVSRFIDLSPAHFTTKLYAAILLTLIGVLVIFITSKIFRDK